MFIVSVFGDHQVGDPPWRPGKRVWVLNIFGDTHLDFRQTELDATGTHVGIFQGFGDVKVVVAPHMPVTVGGFSLFGDRTVEPSAAPGTEAADSRPPLRITTINLFGDVAVIDAAGS